MILPVLSRVPQGSRLMLYLIYVYYLPRCIKYSYTLIFADDIKCILWLFSCNDSTSLHNYIYEISHWCSQWKLLFKKFMDVIFSLSITTEYTSQN